ncbi:STE3-like pheromone receptor [Mycena venus]|uniref:STE3-like pheromone receptor n=1 Tax=Mycena venus TaxID=2733690 RepID=A0A8H7CRC8_9AGAR|nr:STE3-like pheromone receptor [Mycena venus]
MKHSTRSPCTHSLGCRPWGRCSRRCHLHLVLRVLPWHLQPRNSGTYFRMIWAALACLKNFICFVVWADHTINKVPVWCNVCASFFSEILTGTPMGPWT